MNLKEETFQTLYEDLSRAKPEYETKGMILCPICLRGITKAEILCGGVEHIIPKVVIRKDKAIVQNGISINQRCGITVLCQKERRINESIARATYGCNGFKGGVYDRLFKNLFDFKSHSPRVIDFRHRVAILVMAYLGAFQRYGYEYILRPEFDEIRSQFDHPDVKMTQWLERVSYKLPANSIQVITDADSHPFMFFRYPTTLSVTFRRCRAFLPPVPRSCTGVKRLENLNK